MPNKSNKPSFTINNSNVEGLTFFYDNAKKYDQSTKNRSASIKFKLDSDSYDKFFDIFQQTTKKRKELFELEKEVGKLKKEEKKEQEAKEEEIKNKEKGKSEAEKAKERKKREKEEKKKREADMKDKNSLIYKEERVKKKGLKN